MIRVSWKLIAVLVAFLLVPGLVMAEIGVGVGTGKIVIDEPLYPGTIYELPILTIVNTGDEKSEYEVGVAYHDKQPELRPSEDWFSFSPSEFFLEPGGVQSVEMKLNLPVKTEPGDYFAYLEGRPLAKAESGITRIGIAAATKIYFKVKPANAVLGVYHKFLSGWKVYAPWPARIMKITLVVALIFVFKKYFKLNIQVKKKRRRNE
jgi:hypothetical protein